jgi:calcineurin-like phosphoesterase
VPTRIEVAKGRVLLQNLIVGTDVDSGKAAEIERLSESEKTIRAFASTISS